MKLEAFGFVIAVYLLGSAIVLTRLFDAAIAHIH